MFSLRRALLLRSVRLCVPAGVDLGQRVAAARGHHAGVQIRPSRAIAVLAAVTVLLIALSVAALLVEMRKRALENTRLATVSLAHVLREQVRQTFDNAGGVLRGVQDRMHTNYGSHLPLESPTVLLLLSARMSSVRELGNLYIIDTAGNVVNRVREDPSLAAPQSGREFFKALAEGRAEGLYIDRPVRAADGTWVFQMAQALSGPGGEFRGVVAATMGLPSLEQFANLMKVDYGRHVSLYLDDGTLLACHPSRDGMVGERPPELGGVTLPGPGQPVGMFTHVGGDGAREDFALGRVGSFPLVVGVANDEEPALAQWREVAAAISLVAAGVIAFIVVAAMVLTHEVKREASLSRALSDANDRYHRTIESVMDAIVAIDATGTVRLFNPAAEAMFGVPAGMMVGQPLDRLIPPSSRASHARYIQAFMRSSGSSRTMAPNVEITGLRTDGTEFPIESTISQTVIDGQVQLTAVLRDVTQRRRAESDLREMNAQLRSLSQALQDVREEERTRIAMELHDDLGQQLTGLKLELSWIGGRIKGGRAPAMGEFDAIRHQLDAAISSVRRIAAELRPLILGDLGFADAVAWQAGELSRRSGLVIDLDLQAAGRVESDAAATALFRIVQESLTNVTRHSGATCVEIALREEGDELVLTVSDDGRGMAGGRGGGIGLVSMRERAMALGGSFSAQGGAGAGTTIRVALPIDSAALPDEVAA